MKSQKQQIREIYNLLNKAEPRLASAFLESVSRLEDVYSLNELKTAIERGNYSYILSQLNLATVGTAFIPFSEMIETAFRMGGNYGVQIAQASNLQIRFNVANPATSAFLRNYEARLLTEVTQEARKTITQIIAREVNAGTNPLETARMIRQNIGLTATQERYVENARNNLLRQEYGKYLERTARDKRFDATVRNAMRDDKFIAESKVDKMVDRYREKLLKSRSETIARTESIRAIQSGNHELFRQAVSEGKIRENQIVREWIPNYDEKLREAHREIPKLNPDGVGLNEPFKSPLGNIMYPGDPNASASNTINCRCTVFQRIKFVSN